MRSRKIVASVLAFSIISGAATSNAGMISKYIPVNSITASAGYKMTTADGLWEIVDNQDNTCSLHKYLGTSSTVYIPETVKHPKTNKSLTITEIDPEAFKDNTTIKTVSVCRGITVIKNNTFANAKNLSQVNLPHGINTIEYNAFKGTNIKSISLPVTVKKIADGAFLNCPLESINWYNGIEVIGHNAFENTKLKSVIIPSSVNEIDYEAFKNCSLLRDVTFDNVSSNCKMEHSIFDGCNRITNINMNIEAFESAARDGALGGCPNLSKINNRNIVGIYASGEPYFSYDYGVYLKKYFAANEVYKVSFMNDYLDALIPYIAKNATAGCTTNAEKVRALHDWLCNKVDYAYDSKGKPERGNEVHCDGSAFFRDTTVCDGYGRAFTLLCRAAGIEAYLLESSDHVWTMVKLGDHYFHVDVCHDDGSANLSHYLKSDTDLKKCDIGHNSSWRITKPSSRFKYVIPELPECEYSVGDANMDHVVDRNDSDYICNILLGNKSEKDRTLTDVNGDGTVDMLDAISVHDLIIR